MLYDYGHDFNSADCECLVALYHASSKRYDIALDDMPYHESLEAIHVNLIAMRGRLFTIGEVYRKLIKMRKAGTLGKVSRNPATGNHVAGAVAAGGQQHSRNQNDDQRTA